MDRNQFLISGAVVLLASRTPSSLLAADNCTGYDVTVSTMSDTRDVGQNMTFD